MPPLFRPPSRDARRGSVNGTSSTESAHPATCPVRSNLHRPGPSAFATSTCGTRKNRLNVNTSRTGGELAHSLSGLQIHLHWSAPPENRKRHHPPWNSYATVSQPGTGDTRKFECRNHAFYSEKRTAVPYPMSSAAPSATSEVTSRIPTTPSARIARAFVAMRSSTM